MDKKLTIKDIAKKAGVSVSTVSRVLNNHQSVKPEKRALIQQIIDQEHFQPSMFARGMINNQSKNIAIVVPDISNPYFSDLIINIDIASRKLGYSVLLFNTSTAGNSNSSNPVAIEAETFQTILEKKVDGTILLGGEIDRVQPDEHYLENLNLLNSKIPVVIVGQPIENSDATFLVRPVEEHAKIALQHLLALGHQKIGFIGGEPGIRITEDRLKAFTSHLELYSSVHPDWIVLNDFYGIDGYHAMTQILALDDRPEALVAINDKVAMGAIRALNDHGLKCPQDIAIVSCDSFKDSEFYSPRITSVQQDNFVLGQKVVDMLIHAIDDKTKEQQIIHADYPTIVIRESCGIKLKKNN